LITLMQLAWLASGPEGGPGVVSAMAPYRYLLDHQPEWPLVTLVGGTTAVLIFFEPIHRFLRRLRRWPHETEPAKREERERAPRAGE
jgi:hypothetical protein